MPLLPLHEATDLLRRAIVESDEAFERCELILQQQHLSLRSQPPHRLSEAVRAAALPRLRDGVVVLARDRFPLERGRVAALFARLARGTLAESAPYEDASDAYVGLALPRALADDGPGLLDVPHRVGLAASAATSLLREALKPELIRVSAPFEELVLEEAPRARACPLCGSAPAVGTTDGALACRWCGLAHREPEPGCAQCGAPSPRSLDLSQVLRGGRLEACLRCSEVTPRFPVPADPLLLSLCAVIAAPLALAARMRLGGEPRQTFAVF